MTQNLSVLAYQASRLGVLLTLFMLPVWLKWPASPRPFTATYITGFVLLVPMGFTVLAWMLSGFHGITRLLQQPARIMWAVCLLVLVGWAIVGQSWAYTASHHMGVAQNAALQLAFVTAFALVVACAPPPPQHVIRVLIAVLVIHGLIGGLQVALQSSLGLSVLGEFTLDPALSGVSVIQAGEVRWLRPYGLLPHPNIYAGFMVIGTLAAASWVITAQKRQTWAAWAVYAFGLWMLLLTFSRGAWLGFGIGALTATAYLLPHWRRLRTLVLLSVLLGLLFLALYRPLVFARAGIGGENTELRSIADRTAYLQIGLDAVYRRPMFGFGGGNFPWYAQWYLQRYTDYDLRGDNVHQVWLGVWAEYGAVGFALLSVGTFAGIVATMNQIRHNHQAHRVALLAGFAAWVVIGLYDHYPWTLIQSQALWLCLLPLTWAQANPQQAP